MFCDITDALSFSFPFLLSPSSIEYFNCYKHVLHMILFMIMLGFVYCLSYRYILHVWEKICSLCVSDPGLLHITWCPPIASNHVIIPHS
jgi:hypothetical protein